MTNFETITDVKSLFKLYQNKKINILILGGNKGDGVIYYGARNLMSKNNIKFLEILSLDKLDNLEENELFIYGCGGYCKFYNNSINKLKNKINNFKKVFILPSTIDCSIKKVHNFINHLGPNILVFCREKTSYNHVIKSIKYKNNVRLDNDLAFNGDYTKFFFDKTDINKNNLLIALRKDIESLKNWNISQFSNDISNGSWKQYEEFINEINTYSKVITDRAHVAIVASLLNKEVYILPDGYYKVKAIYEYSLKNKFNV